MCLLAFSFVSFLFTLVFVLLFFTRFFFLQGVVFFSSFLFRRFPCLSKSFFFFLKSFFF